MLQQSIPQENGLWQPICTDRYTDDFTVVVKKGYGATHVARDLVQSYVNAVALTRQPGEQYIALTPEEKVFAEDMLVKRAGLSGKQGQTIGVTCEVVEDAAREARTLTAEQKDRLTSYGDAVDEFEGQETIRQIVDEAFEGSSIQPQVITIE